MNTKQRLWTRAADVVATHMPEIEDIDNVESRKRVIGAIYREMLKAHEDGVELSLLLIDETEPEPTPVLATA